MNFIFKGNKSLSIMKKIILPILLFLSCKTYAQGGWTKILNAGNPVTTFSSNGFYKGCAWIDFDNDGLIDLSAAPNFLFKNLGAGNFTTVTTGILPAPMQDPGGVSWADLNGDTLPDLILAEYPSKIYLNAGGGNFTDFSPNLPNFSNYAAWGCSIGDYNKDNRLDLLYVHANGFHGAATPSPCRLYAQKTGTFAFVQKTGYAFTDSLKPYTVPYWSDYDQDGDADLFIASGPGGAPGYDYCYKNMKVELGIDTLYRMSNNSFTLSKQDGQCYNFIDYDNDKDLDLCLTNYNGNQTRFYNNNSGVYSFTSTPFTLIQQNLSNCWGDYDNDGDLDVIITSDNTVTRYFRNDGNNTFTQLTITLNNISGSAGITNGDYDNDGDLDVFIHGAGNARSLFRNDTVASIRKFVSFKLIGVTPNINAIGAKIKIKATLNGVPTWQYREISAQNSFQSQNDLRVHFGLNNAINIDSLIINWPSGTNQTYTNIIPANFYTVKELGGLTTAIKENVIKEESFFVYPNPSKNTIHVKLNFQANKNSSLTICNLEGKDVYNQKILSNEIEIDVSNFVSGAYIVSIINNNKMLTQKLVIE